MLINGIINGVSVPVEVTEEELNSHGYRNTIDEEAADYLRFEGAEIVKTTFLDYLVRLLDVTEEQSEYLPSSVRT